MQRSMVRDASEDVFQLDGCRETKWTEMTEQCLRNKKKIQAQTTVKWTVELVSGWPDIGYVIRNKHSSQLTTTTTTKSHGCIYGIVSFLIVHLTV